MKLNRITASLLTVFGTQMLAQSAFADRIIQRPSGEFYIVSDRDAAQAFDRNNFGFIALPPSVNSPSHNTVSKGVVKKIVSKIKPLKSPDQCQPVNCPVTPPKPTQMKPVTTVESAESIFLRLEQKK